MKGFCCNKAASLQPSDRNPCRDTALHCHSGSEDAVRKLMATRKEIPMARGFAGTVALVTGARSGIGRASALAFASEGTAVVVSDVAVNIGCFSPGERDAAQAPAGTNRAELVCGRNVHQSERALGMILLQLIPSQGTSGHHRNCRPNSSSAVLCFGCIVKKSDNFARLHLKFATKPIATRHS